MPVKDKLAPGPQCEGRLAVGSRSQTASTVSDARFYLARQMETDE